MHRSEAGHEDHSGHGEGGGWLAPWDHRHASPAGTPYVHGFLSEPAFLGRDVIVAYDTPERAIEAEIEWALTQRIGLVAEAGWSFEESGWEEGAFAVRGLLLERERALFSVSGGALAYPEWGWGMIAHAWADLGRDVTVQATAGVERVPAAGETAWTGTLTLAKSFRIRPLLGGRHGTPHVSLLAEAEVASVDDETEGAWLLGAAWSIAAQLDLRAAYRRSFEGEDGALLEFIWHF